jgi:hypothetical protein
VDKEQRFIFVRTAENFIEHLKEESDWLKQLSEAVRQGDHAKARELEEEFDRCFSRQ